MNYLEVAKKYISKKRNKSEKEIETEVRQFFEKETPFYIIKIHGSAFQKPGIPDLLLCVNGWFIGIEIKNNTGVASDVQKIHIRNIKKAGGIAFVAKGDNALFDIINFLQDEYII
jgi:hypothetical protein